jgi:NAD+ kinase
LVFHRAQLGGDGTVLFTSWLFQRIVPPVIPFALGSLGFLTNFDYASREQVISAAIESGVRVNLRMRFTCTVYRACEPDWMKRRRAVRSGETGEIYLADVSKGGWAAVEGDHEQPTKSGGKDREVMCFSTRPAETFEVLNDLVVDRGPSPYVSLLELFGEFKHAVQAGRAA